MKMNKKKISLILISYIIVIIGISCLIYDKSYYDLFMFIAILLSIIFLNRYASVITGLNEENVKVKFFKKFNLLLVFIVSIIGIFSRYINIASINQMDKERYFGLIIGFLIIVFGNYLPKIPFNQFVGIRLPWTVSDEDTWRYSHRLAGKLAFPTGVLIMLGSSFLKVNYVISTTLGVWLVICVLLSYIFYRKKMRGIK